MGGRTLSAPLFACDAARIDAPGGTLAELGSASADARSLLLVGNWDCLFELARGRAALGSGTLTVCGIPFEEAVAGGALGVALLDPELGDYTVEQWLTASARLAGVERRAARELALAALRRVELGALGDRRLRSLGPLNRRAAALAHGVLDVPLREARWAAHLGSKRPVLIERLAEDLAEPERSRWWALLLRVLEGRPWLAQVADGAWAREARAVFRGAAAELVLGPDGITPGPPPLPRPGLLALRVLGDPEPLRLALVAEGCEVVLAGPPGPRSWLTVGLPPGCEPTLALRVALEVDATLLELVSGLHRGAAPAPDGERGAALEIPTP